MSRAARKPTPWYLWPWRLITSYTLAVATLLGLTLITWLGTLYQVDNGIIAAQRMYFESWFLRQELPGGAWIPLPGGYLLMALLTANILAGGLIQLRRRWDRLGIAITHFGIVFLIMAGAVRFHFAEDGLVALYEGQSATVYADSFSHEMVLIQDTGDGGSREFVLPLTPLPAVTPDQPLALAHPDVPFTVTVDLILKNSQPIPAGAPVAANAVGPTVDDYRLFALPVETEGGRIDNPGAVVRVTGPAGEQTALLWTGCQPGRQSPLAVPLSEAGADAWGIVLRRRLIDLPYELRVDDFLARFHPGSASPAEYRSDVTALTEVGEIKGRIQMNEPLREGGLVIYQSGWGPQGEHDTGAPLYSILTVADNPADVWPLLSCIIIAAGLIIHFCLSFARFVRKAGKRVATATPAAVLAIGLLFPALGSDNLSAAEPTDERLPTRGGEWHQSVVHAAMAWPVQEGGRVQPLARHAGFLLLRCYGSRALRVTNPGTGESEKLSPTAWYLDLLYYPEQAMTYPIFRIDSDEVVRQLGLDVGGKKRRDRYSYMELQPGLIELERISDEISALPEEARSRVQEQVLDLADNVGSVVLVLRAGQILRGTGIVDSESYRAAVNQATTPRFLPPMDPDELEWWSIRTFHEAIPGNLDRDWSDYQDLLQQMVRLGQSEPGSDDAVAAAEAVRDALSAKAVARDEGQRIGMEVVAIRADLVYRALLVMILAVVLTCVMWLLPRNRWTAGSVIACLSVAWVMLMTYIVMRGFIRGKYPLSNLYEVTLFITAMSIPLMLIVEWFDRHRIWLSKAAIMGALLLFVARMYESADASDHLAPLQAVLDTNFWLATHVTVVTLGYAAGLVAALVAHVPVGERLWRAITGEDGAGPLEKRLSRGIYGMIAFGLIFSTVGTILGGIWANESWGRFWGWDPKENGALMIVLWQIAILHARLAGWLRPFGVALASIALGVIVAFSWWHVNLLGVGLHSYGFTGGVKRALVAFYAIEGFVLVLGITAWVITRKRHGPTLADAGPDAPAT